VATKRPHKNILTILSALALLAPITANRSHISTNQDTGEITRRQVLIEDPADLQSTKKYTIFRQVGLILAQNFVETNRLNSPNLVLAGLQALAQAFPLQVEFADAEKVPLFLTSHTQVTLCQGHIPKPSQFCEATPRSPQNGLSAKSISKENLLRIENRVFRIAEQTGSPLESARRADEVSKILREIERATGKDANTIAHVFLNGLLVELDPHTNFLNAEEYKNIKDETHGQFGGVGIVL
jgi:hypothetical protein